MFNDAHEEVVIIVYYKGLEELEKTVKKARDSFMGAFGEENKALLKWCIDEELYTIDELEVKNDDREYTIKTTMGNLWLLHPYMDDDFKDVIVRALEKYKSKARLSAVCNTLRRIMSDTFNAISDYIEPKTCLRFDVSLQDGGEKKEYSFSKTKN